VRLAEKDPAADPPRELETLMATAVSAELYEIFR